MMSTAGIRRLVVGNIVSHKNLAMHRSLEAKIIDKMQYCSYTLKITHHRRKLQVYIKSS